MTRRPLWIGFLVGVLFGTIGLLLLTAAGAFLPPLETLVEPLLAPGGWTSEYLYPEDFLTQRSLAMIFVGNGAFYGLLGLVMQAALGRADRR